LYSIKFLISVLVGKFGIAWVMTKFTEPFRLALTIAITPTVGKLLGKATAAHDKDD
jgi:hypothetical protein